MIGSTATPGKISAAGVSARKWPALLVIGALMYAWVAVGIVPMSYFLKAQGFMPDSTAANAIVEQYCGLGGVFYHLAAAACALLLLLHSKHAVWPAVSVAGWVLYVQLAELALRSSGTPSSPRSVAQWFILIQFSGAAWLVWRWRRRGVLQ